MPVFNHKWLFPRVQKDCWVDFSIMLVSSCNSWVLLSFPMEASSPVDVKLTDWVGRGRMEEGALPLTWRAHPLTHWDHHEEEQTSVHQRHSSVVYFSKWNSCFLVYKMWMMKLMAWDNERERPLVSITAPSELHEFPSVLGPASWCFPWAHSSSKPLASWSSQAWWNAMASFFSSSSSPYWGAVGSVGICWHCWLSDTYLRCFSVTRVIWPRSLLRVPSLSRVPTVIAGMTGSSPLWSRPIT